MKTIERKIKLINEYVDHMPQKAEALEPLFTNLEQLTFMIWQHNDQKQKDFSGYIGSDLWKRNVALIDSLKLKVINSTLEIL
jgi:hypothetical protein